MSRQPRQTPLVEVLRQSAASAAASSLYLAQTLSARVAESEFAAVVARKAAAAALAAAATAQAAAEAASVAAAAAYAQAVSAANAAIAARQAADGVNGRVAVLNLTELWAVDPPRTKVGLPTTLAPVPGSAIEATFGPYPLVVFFSVELCPRDLPETPPAKAPDPPPDLTTAAEISIAVDGVEIPGARRIASFNAGVSFETTLSIPAGTNHGRVEAFWRCTDGHAVCRDGRRQLSVLRLGTP